MSCTAAWSLYIQRPPHKLAAVAITFRQRGSIIIAAGITVKHYSYHMEDKDLSIFKISFKSNVVFEFHSSLNLRNSWNTDIYSTNINTLEDINDILENEEYFWGHACLFKSCSASKYLHHEPFFDFLEQNWFFFIVGLLRSWPYHLY